MTENKQIVFTGHSSGGAIAILMTVWFLQQQYKPDPTINLQHPYIQPDPRMPPLCITFGSPLVGDKVFSHALGRENWSEYFFHFVSRYDIVPRVLFAPLSSIKGYLHDILHYLNPKSTLTVQEPVGQASNLFVHVMRSASSLTSHVACQLMGNTNKLSETWSRFIELSPYRPFGNYVFYAQNGTEVVLAKNPDAILQVLFYSSQLLSMEEGPQIALRSVEEHLKYQHELQSFDRKFVTHLDSLDGLPLSSNGGARIDILLNILGLVSFQVNDDFNYGIFRFFESNKPMFVLY